MYKWGLFKKFFNIVKKKEIQIAQKDRVKNKFSSDSKHLIFPPRMNP